MDEYDIKRLAAIESIKAKLEGMKAENEHRLQQGWSISYGEDAFLHEADNLMQLAIVSDENLQDLVNSLT